TYHVPIIYDGPTNSVSFTRGDRRYVLPLPSTNTGVILADPQRGALVHNPLRVQGQANVFEGHLVIELRDAGDRLIARSFTTAGMGGFYPFSTLVYYNMPTQDAAPGRLLVYAPDPSGRNRILAQARVNITLASTR
ncbi:MAG TPA: Gmad2 immunoglobulin-like domain-containing protein, partial [Armatimonadota bacterium]